MPIAMHYERAFDAIARDERQTLLVAESDGFVAGTASVVVVANLSHIGRPYAIVENVVVDASFRGKGIGDAMLNHATEIARNAGCYKVALTSNKSRVDAHRFYERLGFKASHEGFRLDL
jgi:GNAT superfamily N-acetyltransferase